MSKEDVNVIVPFGFNEAQPEREALLHFVVEECIGSQTYPNIRTVIIESSYKPTQQAYAKKYADEYHYIPLNGQLFSPAIVQNEGFLRSKHSNYTYIHQADFLLPPEMVDIAIDKMKDLHAPFVFPYFSSMNLSKPLTDALISNTVDWTRVLERLAQINHGTRKETNNTGIENRKYLSDEELQILESILPPYLQVNYLLTLGNQHLWGEDDGQFNYFGDSFKAVQSSEALVKYRPGGRAKASYLANSRDYDHIGGPPNYIGWGYEDLGLWARVQAVYNYHRGNDGEMYFNNISVSTDYPIVHIWHSTTQSHDYFAMTEPNRQAHEAFMAMSREDQAKSLIPLGKYSK
jgi:hypothetical protein